MAPVIWGLDLAEMQWGKFSSKYMFGNKDYHLRRTKFVVYQLALIFCVVSESLGTAALSGRFWRLSTLHGKAWVLTDRADYIDEQDFVKRLDPNAYVYNNDYIGAASYNIFAGIFVAFIFGAAFFFDLFWPLRYESQGVRWAWKVCGVLAVLIHLASALTLTVITATHRGYVTGVSKERGRYLVGQFHKDDGTPLDYKHNPRAVAAVVFVWLGWVSVVPSCMLLFLSIDNTEKGPGPKSAHADGREEAHVYATHGRTSTATDAEKSVQEPEPAHHAPAQIDGAAEKPLYAAPTAEYPSNAQGTETHPGHKETQGR